MNWELFYLICFVVGFAFTALSFLSGTLHFHFHFPHGHIHFGGQRSGPARWSRAARPWQQATQGGHFPFFNPMSIAVFLAWFGGTDTYWSIFATYGFLPDWGWHGWPGSPELAWCSCSSPSFSWPTISASTPLTLKWSACWARVSDTIRNGGTGEIIFEQLGARKACPARGDSGEEVQRDEEVVVTRYEHGVAYVRRWNELAEKAGLLPEEEERIQ